MKIIDYTTDILEELGRSINTSTRLAPLMSYLY